MPCTTVLEALRARYERDKLVIFSAEKEMTLSLAQALSRSPSKEQAAAVMAELSAILASDSFSSCLVPAFGSTITDRRTLWPIGRAGMERAGRFCVRIS